MQISNPYLLFLGDVQDQLAAKTAQGIVDWRRDWCLGQLRMPSCRADVGIPDMTIEEAVKAGARTLIVGVANAGGVLPEQWTAPIVEALSSGLDVAAGLHMNSRSGPPSPMPRAAMAGNFSMCGSPRSVSRPAKARSARECAS